jgi:CheY-like chemotaxis protein
VKRVLIAEDEPMLRQVLADLFADEGYGVLSAADGREALDILATDQPDLIVMDVMMPNLDGRQAYQAIRSQPTLCDIPVIMMSAAITRHEFDASVSAFLQKPFDIDRLIALVVSLIGPGTTAPDAS